MKFAAIAKEVTTVQQQKQQKLPLYEMSETGNSHLIPFALRHSLFFR